MDHDILMKTLSSRKNIEDAFDYALYDRINNDWYYDFFEIEWAWENKVDIIDGIVQNLKTPRDYIFLNAYAFYPPKTELCYRRMVYIRFKDLVLRYAYLNVLTEYLDRDLSDTCFANRRSHGQPSTPPIMQNFATESWPNFCNWQKELTKKYNVLVRTDISSFFDSISHEYLTQIIASELCISDACDFLQLFKKMLKVPVISYNHSSGRVSAPEIMEQGLPIGNGSEGFLANLYLKKIDEQLTIDGIEYGRYCDDMRIFAVDRPTAHKSLLVLQELLLTKGLNLNSAKTRIAENEDINQLRSKDHDLENYSNFDNDPINDTVIIGKIDAPFDEFDKTFTPNECIDDSAKAKDYCKYLSAKDKEGNLLIEFSDRCVAHIDTLESILINWPGSSKHACWLIIQSFVFDKIPLPVQVAAKKALIRLLKNEAVIYYVKYRLLHHLLKTRKNHKTGESYQYLSYLTGAEKNQIKLIVPKLLRQPSFALNIIGLYYLKSLNNCSETIQKYMTRYMKKPIGNPVKEIFNYFTETFQPDNLLEYVSDEILPDDYAG
jgi:hypothetical protein